MPTCFYSARLAAFSSSTMAHDKWWVLAKIGASGYVGNVELIRAQWLSLHWMVVIETALCAGVCCPSPPLIMLITQTCWTVFYSGNRLLLFFTCSPLLLLPLSYRYPLSPSFSHQSASPLFILPSPLIPWGSGREEREREGEGEKRQDKPALLKTLFTPGTKQHVISALGETLTRAGKEGEGGGRTDRDRRAGSEAELKPQQACDWISWW